MARALPTWKARKMVNNVYFLFSRFGVPASVSRAGVLRQPLKRTGSKNRITTGNIRNLQSSLSFSLFICFTLLSVLYSLSHPTLSCSRKRNGFLIYRSVVFKSSDASTHFTNRFLSPTHKYYDFMNLKGLENFIFKSSLSGSV